jgi:hypothetical protein
VLKAEGEVICYLESTKVNLRQYAGKRAIVKGTLEYNTDDADLPVLVVTALEEKGVMSMHRWTFGKSTISFDVPVAWKQRGEEEFVTFTTEGSYTPLLSVFLEDLDPAFTSASSGNRSFMAGQLLLVL